MIHTACFVVLALAATSTVPEKPAEAIEIPAMLIKLIEQVDVPARTAGALAAVKVSEGQMVGEGSLLAQVVDIEAQITEKRAQTEVAIARIKAKNDINIRYAKKSVEVAKAELRRSLESIKKYAKSISDSELDRLQLIVEKGGLEVEQAEHESQVAAFTRQIKENEYQAAQQAVKQHRIVAPIGGVVVQVAKHNGEWVKPGDTVIRILRLDRLRAEGFVKARDLGQDLQGCEVELKVDLPNTPGAHFSGTVVFLDPEIDPVNSQVRIWAEIQNKELRLRPGMRANMTVRLPSAKH